MDKRCIIKRNAGEGRAGLFDEHRRKIVAIAIPAVLRGVYLPIVHHNCSCSMFVAISNRVVMDVPLPTAAGMKLIRALRRRVTWRLPIITPWEYPDMPNSFSGPKQAKYMLALHRLMIRGKAIRSDAKCTAFIKCEKMSPMAKDGKALEPRVIHFRDPKFCVAIAPYLKPIEHYLYAKDDYAGMPQGRLIGKGLSLQGRANLAIKKWKEFLNPTCLTFDMSRFDAHVSEELLREEHAVYLSMNSDPEFARLLSWQLKNYCSSDHWRYTVVGRRMTGDMNTALGNCLIMLLMVCSAMNTLKVKYQVLDDGDDCLVYVETGDLERVLEEIPPILTTFGHEVKIENIAHSIEDIVWCQSKIIFDGQIYRFIRDPIKTLSCSLVGPKLRPESLKFRSKLVNTIGKCQLYLNAGIPILQEYSLACVRNANSDKFVPLRINEIGALFHIFYERNDLDARFLARVKPQPITDEARFSFSRAYGISEADQLDAEKFLASWKFGLMGDTTTNSEYRADSWESYDIPSCIYRPFGI